MSYSGSVPYQCGNLDEIKTLAKDNIAKVNSDAIDEICDRVEEIRVALGRLRDEVDSAYERGQEDCEYTDPWINDDTRYNIEHCFEEQKEALFEFICDRFNVDKWALDVEWRLYKSMRNVKDIEVILREI